MPIAHGEVFLGLEPGGVLSEEVNGDRIDLGQESPLSSMKASKVSTPDASRCQSIPDRRNIPSGMWSVQKLIGRPTTTVSTPRSMACAATAIP